MSEKKLENVILWVVNGSLILIVFCMIFLLYTSVTQFKLPFFLHDPSFLGSLIGAVITGMIAIVVFKLQKTKENILEKQHFKKIYNENKRNLTYLNEVLSKMGNEIQSNEYQNPKEVEVLKHFIKGVRTEVQAVDIKEVPYEIHEYFSDLKDALTTITLCTDVLFEVTKLGFLKDEFLISIHRYQNNLKQIESYLNEIE